MCDDCVQPDDLLITKLRLRIEQDLKQINGVYDVKIAEAEEINRKLCLKIQAEHNGVIELINKQRNNDISLYNEKAEKNIDNLISTMHSCQEKPVESWWSKIFG